jgi:hypothetical protein
VVAMRVVVGITRHVVWYVGYHAGALGPRPG